MYREECALLERKLELTNAAVEEAEAELAAGGSPDDSRARLLAKVRTDNERTKALTAALAEHTDERNRLTRLAAELDRDIAERERGGGQEAKYDELFRRDEEMTQFIDRYPEMRSKEEAEQAVSDAGRGDAERGDKWRGDAWWSRLALAANRELTGREQRSVRGRGGGGGATRWPRAYAQATEASPPLGRIGRSESRFTPFNLHSNYEL